MIPPYDKIFMDLGILLFFQKSGSRSPHGKGMNEEEEEEDKR
jgi:hypothetical protein